MSSRPLPSTADVVVIGGGAIGSSTAFHLSEAGAGDVVLLDQGALAGGSTSKAAGGFRTQFSDPLNVAISQRSRDLLLGFADRPGWDIDVRQVGYLFLLTSEAEVEVFEDAAALQRSMGLDTQMLTPDVAREIVPLLTVGDVLAASYSPGDGTATPEALVHGYAAGLRRHGGIVRTGCRVTAIETRAGEITAVHTTEGIIATGAVVCAAGTWSKEIGAMVGVDLPVEPLRRQIVFTEPVPDLEPVVPLTIDLASGYYFHREGEGLLMGMPDPGAKIGFDEPESPAFQAAMFDVIARRAPALLDVGVRPGWWGLHEMSPDHNALVGEAPHVSRFLYATGFSGHGFQQSPAIGEIVRDLVLGVTPFVDISPLDARRFQAGELRKELHVI